MSPHARTGPPVRTTFARLALLVGLLVALALTFGGQPSRLGRTRPIATSGGQGYWLLARDGGIFGYGDAPHFGTNLNAGNDIVGLAPTPTLKGYWTADDDGTVFAHGDAVHHGNRVASADDIRAFAARPQGDGYWLVSRDGAVFAFGAAPYLGNTPALGSNSKIVGMAATPSGNGYWLVGRDGGIFAFGDAGFYGSTGAITLNQPIVGMARTPSGNGYWFVAADGGVFAFGGASYKGTTVPNTPPSGIKGLAASPSGNGYWLVAGNGKVFPFGDAGHFGDASSLSLSQPIIGIAATPVVRTNAVPAAVADSASVAEDGSASIDVLANDAGLADTPVSVSIVSGPAHGTASVAGNKISYSPAANYNGSDSITYRVSDAGGESATAVLSIDVTGVNDAPTAANRSLTTDEDLAAGGTLSGNDIDGHSLTYSVVAQPAHGSVSVSGSNYTYTPAANYHGADSFTYRANDGSANSNTATVSVTVKPVNDAPVVSNVSVGTNEDTPLDGAPQGSDIDGDELEFELVDLPEHGELLSHEDGGYTYTPDPDFNGTDTLTHRASDGALESELATVTINVLPVDDPGTALDGALATDEDESASGTLTATDVDASAFVIVSGPSHGTVSALDPVSGTYTYTPAANFHGNDSFTFAADGNAESPAVATVSITVASVEDAPVFVNSGDTGGFLDISTSGADIGNHSDDLDTPVALPFPVNFYGTEYNDILVSSNGWIAFDLGADLGWTETDLPLADGTPAILAWWDDLETYAPSGIRTQTIGDAPHRQFIVQWNVTHYDLGEAGGSISFQVIFTEGEPTVRLRYADVSFPSEEHDGGLSATIGLNQDAETASDHAFHEEVAIWPGLALLFDTSINEVDLEELEFLTTLEDEAFNHDFPATDGDGDPLDYAIATPPAVEAGTAAIDTEGHVTFSPAAEFSGTVTFTISVTDTHSAAVTKAVIITVLPVNDDPTFDEDSEDSKSVDEEGTVTGDVDASDVDSIGLEFSIEDGDGPEHGTASVDPETGAWSYTGTLDFAGQDGFTITVSDGDGGSATIDVEITVTNVNDTPTALSIGAHSTDEDVPLVVDLTLGDVDTDDVLSITVGSSNLALLPDGALVPDGSGAERTLTITPAPNASGTALVFVAVEDGNGGLALQQFVLTVNPVNDLPVANDDPDATTAEDTNLLGTVTGSDPVEGSDLDFSLVGENGGAEHGTVTIDPETGDYTYDPADNYHGQDSFSFVANDGTDDSEEPGTVTINVTPVNDAPVADGDSLTIAEDTDGSGTMSGSDPVEGSPVTFALVGADGGALHGDVTLNPSTGEYTYEPDADFNGSDEFSFVANDGGLDSEPAKISITVTPVNDAPVVSNPGSQSVDEDHELVINFSATDVDEDDLDIVVGWSNPALLPADSVVLDKVAGTITVDPPANLFGDAQIYLSVSDGTAPAVLRQIPVRVHSINDLPVIEGDGPVDLAVDEDDPDGESVTFTATDIEDDPAELAWSASTPANGTVTAGAAGTFTYTPDANFDGSESFTVTVTDQNGGTDTIQVDVTIEDQNNDAPSFAVAIISETGDEEAAINGLVSATDVDSGDSLEYTIEAGDGPTSGVASVDLTTGAWTYTGGLDFVGDDSFIITVTDGDGLTDTIVVDVTVDNLNDAPVAIGTSITPTEDDLDATPGSVTATDIDGDSPTFVLGDAPTKGTAVVAADGTFTYLPDADQNGADSFTVVASDGHGGSDTATVTVTITAVDDDPVIDEGASNLSPELDELLVAMGHIEATDADGDSLSYSIVGDPVGISIDDNGDYTFNGTVAIGLSFTVEVSDGSGPTDTVVVNVVDLT